MIVVVHETIGITPPLLLKDFTTQQCQEMLSVGLGTKDGLLFVAAGRDVIESTGVFEAELASHDVGA